MKKHYQFETLQVHAGRAADSMTHACAVPIYQTASYTFDNSEHGAALFRLEEEGNIYTRLMNPTTDVFEKRMAALDGGVGALATASGMAAILYAILNLAQNGDEIITLSSLYGGTHTLFHDRLETQFGIKVHFVDPENLDAIETCINDKTRAVFFETIGNPRMNIPDIEKIVAIAHRHGVPVVVDNTFATPYLIQLKSHQVDFIVYSATKYIGGHGTSIGGIIVDNGLFDFKGNPRFPQYNAPDTAYHGLVYADLGPAAFITRARVYLLRDTGAVISPFNSFLLLQGLETLSLRMERHVANACAIAEYLKQHPATDWIQYPSLKGDEYYARAQQYLPKGASAMMAFGVKGGKEAGIRFIDSLELFGLMANVGDAKSLAIHPAGTTHSQLDDDALLKAGVLPEMIRLSIGIENAADLIDDMEQAFKKSQA